MPAARTAVQLAYQTSVRGVVGALRGGALRVGDANGLADAGSGVRGRAARTLAIAAFSAGVTQRRYRSLTAIWRATYAHGSPCSAAARSRRRRRPSPVEPAVDREQVQRVVRERRAGPRTSAAARPSATRCRARRHGRSARPWRYRSRVRRRSCVPVYGSCRTPPRTTQPCVPGLSDRRRGRGAGCRCGCRSRCGPASSQAWPNCVPAVAGHRRAALDRQQRKGRESRAGRGAGRGGRRSRRAGHRLRRRGRRRRGVR